jgi:hypothetical protein
MMVAFGLIARLAVAWTMPIPFYYDHFERDVELWATHGNIYAEHAFYNYSPLPMHLLGIAAWLADRLTLPHFIGFRLLFIVGDVLTALIFLRRDSATARRWWLNPAAICFSAFLCSFEIWALAPILFAATQKDADALTLGIVAVLIKQNVAFLVWALYVYHYGVKRGAIYLLLTAAALVATFITYLPDGAEGIWRNVLTYGGGEAYGLGLLLPRWVAAAILFTALLTLPVVTQRLGITLEHALFLSALLFCGLAWGASPAMFALPLVLAMTLDECSYSALTVVCFLLFCPLTWNLASIPIFRVSWFCCVSAVALQVISFVRAPRMAISPAPLHAIIMEK